MKLQSPKEYTRAKQKNFYPIPETHTNDVCKCYEKDKFLSQIILS